jgi:AAA family ATP:ADP antiporter
VFQVVRRATGFALLRPAREILFTVLKREDKYKAKSFIDTFGYRAGDQVGAWSYRGLHDLGLGMRAISFIAVPLIAIWCAISLWLGRKQIALARARNRNSNTKTYGYTNWIGCLGRHTETRQRKFETRQRRV